MINRIWASAIVTAATDQAAFRRSAVAGADCGTRARALAHAAATKAERRSGQGRPRPVAREWALEEF